MRCLALMVAVLALIGGCRSTQGPQAQAPITRGPAPLYAEVAKAYNARVDPLVRLWARTVVQLKFIDADGKEQKEQVEGFCQYVRPDKALVSFTKVGQTIGMLGSNQAKYWWIELGSQKRAYVGLHANVTQERIRASGLRVHPLDVMELLALTPLPANGRVEWSPDGRTLLVTVPGRLGERKLWIDPNSYEPTRIELFGPGENGAAPLAFSELAQYQNVSLKGAGPGVARPRVPTRIRLEADFGATRIVMDLSDPQDDPKRLPPGAFDLERLLESNRVERVFDLDHEAQAADGR